MKTYQRVIPRDLFNEAKLLKCMGQLALIIHDGVRWKDLRVDFHGRDRFRIEQDSGSGGLEMANVYVMLGKLEILMHTAYNSKEPYPLYATLWNEEEVPVFNDDGTLHADFTNWMDEQSKI